ncbi:squalene/phytoene synthase family protein [Polynucleobacter sp. MWH-Svant-W18]|uniref:squalene/phytoene synthase family protein n=1 Tax=Polynucleobacter sp. MWH-Svant-W18 TaxID=1855909 RepID=UPI001BFD79DA|nr:squalene/phytoene synthase family protein [Polynucleobacter sp. MWH-Svant-W18]QWD78160.1 squalene/phytoene synthase family protein [Polynucleobacter sp. MWH-Svant-W18]
MSSPKNHFGYNPNSDLAYQKAILGSVSRTFALTIPLLPTSIEKVVGNTYLLCRIVDTIEDAANLDPDTKQRLSKLFLDAVLEKSSVESFVDPCLAALSDYGNSDELDLIAHTPTVLRILHTCSKADQAAVSRCISVMSEGMSYFHSKQNAAGLKDLNEFEKYCYVVAGVVGELLTTIFSNHSPAFAKQIKSHENLAIAFGQALQMTNILKDSPEDRARGVSWKPAGMDQNQLLQIAYRKLQESLDYIALIPKKEFGMRRFCFLAFGLAVMTLSKIAQQESFNDKDELKLKRKTVMAFYVFTKFAVASDSLMKVFFFAASRPLRKVR